MTEEQKNYEEIQKLQKLALTMNEFNFIGELVTKMLNKDYLKNVSQSEIKTYVTTQLENHLKHKWPSTKKVWLEKTIPELGMEVMAFKFQLHRPEIYAIFYNENNQTQFEVQDEKMMDLYSNNIWKRPDWEQLFS